jgi:FtsP/CotA-like multicopper oxidase with cupredoxin domain
MAGALIVRGSRLPEEKNEAGETRLLPGDIDVLLKHEDGSPFAERILLLQQIQYACRDEGGAIKTDASGWRCDEGDVGVIDKYDDIFGPRTWDASGRYTTINGRTVAPFEQHAQVGRIERWRLIHAGVRDTIKLAIAKRVPPSMGSTSPVAAQDFQALTADEQGEWIDANCAAENETYWQMAADGITRESAVARTATVMQPGYRTDLLLVFDEPGDYCVIDTDALTNESVNAQNVGRRLLTVVTVDPAAPGAEVTDPAAYLRETLVAAARALPVPEPVRTRVVADLEDGLRLAAFVPHEDLRQAATTGMQNLVFSLTSRNPNSGGGTGTPTGPGLGQDQAGARRYDPDDFSRVLTLGAVEDWIMSVAPPPSPQAGHPFHIHVNPFQLISATRPGATATDPPIDLTKDPASEYFGMEGVWKDTLFVQPNLTRITVRTHYRRYIGDFVLHCHILDHEDHGMMENVRVVLPDGLGGQIGLSHFHQTQ